MSAILNSLNVHNFLIFQPILTTLVSKFMAYIALSDKTYILLGLRSPLKLILLIIKKFRFNCALLTAYLYLLRITL